MNFADNMLAFISSLRLPVELPEGIEVMTPYDNAATMEACTSFYKKFYNDTHQRRMIIGINPGRFGGGVTGIPFTDPIRLQNDCGIDNNWAKKQELSSLYIYEMIRAFGGVAAFYQQFYITAVSPLGFTSAGKNLNYYDDKTLQDRIKPFVIDCLKKQFCFGIYRTTAFCLGDGKNYKYLSALNKETQFFENIVPLPHPRFIMQYKLKKKQEYIDRYLQQLGTINS
ncbi:MAG: uracil-DNA glycosylase family protein [Chitinophagaceae bacterium]